MSDPWMPLYIADYLADTRRLSTLEHGAYMLLIMDYWQKGSLPTDDATLARICRMNNREWGDSKSAVLELFHKQSWWDKKTPVDVDHVHPFSRGGAHSIENFAWSCAPCNRSKGAKTVAEWQQ